MIFFYINMHKTYRYCVTWSPMSVIWWRSKVSDYFLYLWLLSLAGKWLCFSVSWWWPNNHLWCFRCKAFLKSDTVAGLTRILSLNCVKYLYAWGILIMRFLLFWIWCPALSLAVGEVGRYRPTYPRQVKVWRLGKEEHYGECSRGIYAHLLRLRLKLLLLGELDGEGKTVLILGIIASITPVKHDIPYSWRSIIPIITQYHTQPSSFCRRNRSGDPLHPC